MHRIGRHAGGVIAVLLVTLLVGCGASPTAAPTAVGTDGVARVRFDHRTSDDGPARAVRVPRGATVELVVGSDTVERVLVPELSQVRYVSAGGTVTLRFVAPGPVTVVLGSGVELGRIDVA